MVNFLRLSAVALTLLFFCIYGNAQQVIGSFPYMNGGFEGQTAGALAITVSSTNWTRQNQTGASSSIVTTSPRSGSQYATVTNVTTASRGLQSPQSSTSTDGPTSSTSYVVQFYVRNAASVNGFQGGVTVNGTSNPTYSTAGTLVANSNWAKQTFVLSTPSNAVTSAGLGIVRSTAGTFDIDDFVIYAGTASDNTAPNAPTAPSVSQNGTNPTTELDVSWAAASGGVDGGGYLVVRGTADPTTAPNANGIYATGNTVASGMTVVYVGTSNSFTDVGLSAGTTYYYRIYTVDKAFNYSSAATGNQTTDAGSLPACTTPTAQPTVLNLTPTSASQIDGSFTAASGSPSGYLVVRYASGGTTTNPTDATTYSAGNSLGSGTVVYSGSSTSFSATGLVALSTYDFYVYAYNNTSCTGGPAYYTTSPLDGSETTLQAACVAPTASATALNLTPQSTTQINGSFTAASGSPSGYLVVRYASGAGTTNPTNATTYSAGNSIGSGTVVSVGSGTTFSATSLSAYTTYDFYVYPYNNTSCTGGPVYRTTSPLTGSATTTNGEIFISAANTNFSQDFNSFVGTRASIPTGWTTSSSTFLGTEATGTSTSGGVRAYGASSEYALGALRTGSVDISFTATFRNTTGVTITALDISYDFEQWRFAGNTTGFTVTQSGIGSSVAGLDQAGAASGTNGVGTATAKSIQLTGLSIANNGTFTITWLAYDLSGSDNGIAIDNFVIKANPVVALVPEIAVSGNGNVINDGDVTPSATDHTAFGNVEVGGTPMTRTFTISNSGTGTLNLTVSPIVSISGSSMFTVTQQPSANSIASGGSPLTFVVTFTPTNTIAQTATISIDNDDSDENPYNFDISGTGSNSQASDVVLTNTTYTYSTNIPYTAYQSTPTVGGSVSGTVAVMRFKVRDGGSALNDNDALSTTLSRIRFTVKDGSNVNQISQIRHAVLATTTNIIFAAVTPGATELDFTNGLGWVQTQAFDNDSSGWILLRVSFKNAGITDNTKFIFQVSGVESLPGGSGFAAADGGAAVSDNSTANDRNRIEVTADRLRFTTQPANGTTNVALASFTISAVDTNYVVDLDATNSFTLTTSSASDFSAPGPYSLSAGVRNITNAVYSAVKTSERITATNTGSPLTYESATLSNAFNISAINYPNGSYRTTSAGTWTSTITTGNATWDSLSAGIWYPSQRPRFTTTNNIFVFHSLNVPLGAGTFGSSSIRVMDGGTFTFDNTSPSTAANMYVYDGGVLQINAKFYIASTGTFEIFDGGTVNINYQYDGTATSTIWQGTEVFHPNSNVVIQDWSNVATDYLMPSGTYSDISVYNNGGYSACFGNLVIDMSGSSSSASLQPFPSGFTKNLTHKDLIFRSSAPAANYAFRMMASGNYTTTIGGNVVVESNFIRPISFLNNAGTITVNIKGSILHSSTASLRVCSSNQTGTNVKMNVDGDITVNAGGEFNLNNASTAAVTVVDSVNLKGDLTISSTSTLQAVFSNNSAGLNFVGAGNGLTDSTTQTIDIASAGTNENRNISFLVKSGAYVRLINRNFELGNSASVTVASGGVLDFGFTGTTALNLQEVTAGASSTSFAVNSGGTIKITSSHSGGAIRSSAASGNVQTDSRTYDIGAVYHFIGKADQFTGDGLPGQSANPAITGAVIVELDNDSLKLAINTGGSRAINAPGYLAIRKGILLDNNDGGAVSFFNGDGLLIMTGGIYRISSVGTSFALPRLSGAYTLSAGVIELNSSLADAQQRLRGGPTYYKVIISGASSGTGYKTITNPISIVKNLQITGTTIFDITSWEMSGTAGLTMDAGLLRMSRTTNSPTLPQINGDSSAYTLTGGTVEFYGTGSGNQHLIRGTYGNSQRVTYYNVEVNATAANETEGNVNAGASFDVNGVMNVNAPAILRLDQGDIIRGTGTVTIHDDAGLFYGNQLGITASGTNGNVRTTSRTFGFGTYGFVSTAAMVSGNGLPAAVKKLFALRTNTTDVATMTNSVSVSETLGFSKGVIATGTRKITVLNGANVTGASSTTGWVNGNLEKYVAAGTNVAQSYEVGDAVNYAPANLTFATVSGANMLTVSTVVNDHPSIASSTVDGSKSVNRYWKLINGGVVFTNYNAVFNFNNPADLDGPAVGNHNSFIGGRYASSAWTYPTVGTKTATSTQLTGLTGFGDYQLGVLQTGVYIWTGAGANPNWTTAANWVGNTVPVNDCVSNVNIPTVSTAYPTINANVYIGNLYVSSGTTITVSADSLSVCGNLTGGSSTNATFVGAGKVVLTGTAQQLISGKLSFETLRLYNSAGAQMQTGSTIDIYTALEVPRGVFNVNGRVLKFKSQSGTDYAYLNNFGTNYTGSISGNVTAELTVPGNNYQHLVGSPVSANLSQFGASGTSGYVQPVYVGTLCHESRSAVGGPYGRVFSWEEDKPVVAPGADCPVYGWKVENNGANPAVAAKGYAAYIRGGTFSVTGSPNQNSTYTVNNLSNTGYALNTIQHPTGDNFTSGWHLISNPYLAPYDILGSLQDGANSANFNDAQIWQASGPFSGTYQSVVSGNFNDNMLAPFQGVMVHRGNGANFAAPTGTATFNFNKNFLREPTTLPQFYRQASREKLSIKITGNGFMDITYVEFNDAATADFDIGYDSRKMFSAVGQPTIYTRQAGEMTSANINHSISEVSTIPLGVSPGADGTFTLLIEGISTFDPTSYVYLEDLVTGTMLNVRNNSLYTFAMSEMDNSERFVLHFTPPMEVSTENSTCITTGTIMIEQPGTADWVYELTDGSNVVSSGVLNQNMPVTVSVEAGNYTLTIADINGYTVVRDIEVLGTQNLNAGLTISTNTAETGQTITFDNTSNSTVVVWDFGDGTIISGISHTEYAYSEPGVYTLVLTIANQDGCTEVLTQQITITESTVSSINPLETQAGIRLWSFNNRVMVDFSALKTVDATIEIFNVLGQPLSTERFGRSSIYSVTLNNLEVAYVIVRVRNENEVVTKKLLIGGSK